MDTRVKSFASAMIGNAVGQIKQNKQDKANNAFYQLFDSAVANSGSSNVKSESMNSLNTLSTKQQNKDYSDVQQKVNATEQPLGQTVQKDTQQVAENPDMKDVVKKVCEELGITEDELSDKLEGLVDVIAQILMEKFQVSEEDLMNVLDTLGLTLLDMLEQPNLMDVAMMLTGTEDIAAILTDGELYSQIQEAVAEIAQNGEQFMEENGITYEELQLLGQNEVAAETMQVAQEAPQAEEDTVTFSKTPVVKEDNVQAVEAEEQDLPELEIVTDQNNAGSKTEEHGSQMTGQQAFQQFVNNVSDYVGVAANTDHLYANQMEMQEIIKQVVDTVKLQVQSDTTSLEMQLHPESYGKLNLHVSVREGAVTAQLAVENEMVKSALEAQVVQLREAMNERGLKVDAVEVTIASHEFERNLEEGQGEQRQEEEARSTQRRQINLNDEPMTLEEMMEMSEAEALARRMMIENGNSIDYSA